MGEGDEALAALADALDALSPATAVEAIGGR
jgi:hypothetical protein